MTQVQFALTDDLLDTACPADPCACVVALGVLPLLDPAYGVHVYPAIMQDGTDGRIDIFVVGRDEVRIVNGQPVAVPYVLERIELPPEVGRLAYAFDMTGEMGVKDALFDAWQNVRDGRYGQELRNVPYVQPEPEIVASLVRAQAAQFKTQHVGQTIALDIPDHYLKGA